MKSCSRGSPAKSLFCLFPRGTRPRSGKAVIWREAPIACTLLFFPFPLRVTHLMVRLKLPYERQVSKMSIYLRTRRNKKSDSLLLAAQRRTSIVASCGCFKPMCESPGQRTLTQTKIMTPDRISNISKHESAFLMAYARA